MLAQLGKGRQNDEMAALPLVEHLWRDLLMKQLTMGRREQLTE